METSVIFIDDTPTPKLADARAVCKNMGGDLAIIKSAEENEFIRSLVMQQNTTTAFGAWLGFKRIKVDSKIYWHDDTLVEGGIRIGDKVNRTGISCISRTRIVVTFMPPREREMIFSAISLWAILRMVGPVMTRQSFFARKNL